MILVLPKEILLVKIVLDSHPFERIIIPIIETKFKS